jgi:hypothetical protein
MTAGCRERRPNAQEFQQVGRAALLAPVEGGVARLKTWRIFRRSRCSPNRMTSIAKATLTLEPQR